MRHALAVTLALSLAALSLSPACSRDEGDAGFQRRSLSPGPNPFGPGERFYSPQPHRDHPLSLASTPDGRKLYVTLQGVEDEPGSEVAVVDLAAGAVARRVRVGSAPTGIRMHPGGRFLAVTNRFSNFASIIDTTTDQVAAEIEVPFYTVDLVFTPDGRRAYLTNRWTDSVLRWDVEAGDTFRVTGDSYRALPAGSRAGIAVGQNPRDIAISPSGDRLYVASPTGLSLSVIDVASERELRRVALRAPPGDVVASGPFVFVSHTGQGTHHAPDEGLDGDGDGQPGDGTANVMFQDVQNEIAVLDPDGKLLHNYTSDSICCHDFRDVDPDHPEKGAALPYPDTWPASRLAFLPPRETWIVAGALPEQMAVRRGPSGDELLVAFSGSNEVQSFSIGPDGALSPGQTAGGLYRTGMNPYDVLVGPDGRKAYVAERLGEHVTVLDLDRGPGAEQRLLVGDVSGGEFPATDAEIGETVNFVTAPFTIDGDQTCVHCHREGGNLGRVVAMPLQTSPLWGSRMVMAYRGASDTRPWFFESAMTEANFFPVINEFNRKENFCCEQLDPLVWKSYPTLDQCTDEPSTAGCNHVLDCQNDPPPECHGRTYGSAHLTRGEHFLAASRALLGRDRTVGDALYADMLGDDGAPTRQGIPLNFDGITRSLGVFLLTRPRFLPNPNAAYNQAAVARGRALYQSPAVGCATCHPLPLTTVTQQFNPSGIPLRLPPVISPGRGPHGEDVDTVTAGFLQTFPTAQQDPGGLRVGVPQLRGLWDRAEKFFHDGRAKSLREALATPGHPALAPGEIGHNENAGMPDTHGATSQLSPQQLDDLIAFLMTL